MIGRRTLPAEDTRFLWLRGDLVDVQGRLRGPFGAEAIVAPGNLLWAAGAAVQRFIPETGGIETFPASGFPLQLSTQSVLSGELAGLGPLTGSLVGGGAPVPGACAPGPPGGGLTESEINMLFDRATVRYAPDLTTVEWRTSPAGSPAMMIRTAFAADFVLDPILHPLFAIFHLPAAEQQHFITIDACDRPGGVCETGGQRRFAGYRPPADPAPDVVFPDTGLEFSVQSFDSTERGSVRIEFTPLCVLVAEIAASVLSNLGIPSDSGGGGPFAACQALATFLSDEIGGSLSGACFDVSQLVSLAVNPPSFRVSLSSILSAASIPLVAAMPAFGFTPGGGGGPTTLLARALTPHTGRVFMDLDPFFGVRTAPTPVGVQGAMTDAFMVGLALGSPTPMVIDDEGAWDFSELRRSCELGDLGPDPICSICASGGTCGPGGCDGFCTADGRIAERLVLPGPWSTGVMASFPIPASPGVAQLLDTSFQTGEMLRRWFARALPVGARYTAFSTTFVRGLGGVADVTYRIDPDRDRVSSATDLCPMTFDPMQADDDADGIGQACDRCPTIVTSRAANDRDRDGDTIADGCDCDLDGDGCFNAGATASGAGSAPCPAPGAGRVLDRVPTAGGSGDTDSDGIPNDCDADSDGDGVADELDDDRDNDGVPDVADNCPDTPNPGQEDSGGLDLGDACDPLCDLVGCADAPPPRLTPVEPAASKPGAVPRRLLCSAPDDPFCDWLPVSLCGARPFDECPGTSLAMVRRDSLEPVFTLNEQGLGDLAGSASVHTAFDADGDGLADYLVAAPDADIGCETPNSPCVHAVGVVRLISSANGATLAEFQQPVSGMELGASIAVSGDLVALGAPGAHRYDGVRTGAVQMYRIEAGTLVYRTTYYGQSADERFGETVVPMTNKRGVAQFLVGAPDASGFAGPHAGRIDRLDELGGVVRSFAGPIMRGHLGRNIATTRLGHGGRGALIVIGGMPEAHGGDGALAFWGPGHRHHPRMARGGRGDALGTTLLLDDEVIGRQRLAAGAPGSRRGAGSIDIFDLHGHRRDRIVTYGEAIGSFVEAAPDFDGDGLRDLAIGVRAPDGSAVTLVLTNLRRRCE